MAHRARVLIAVWLLFSASELAPVQAISFSNSVQPRSPNLQSMSQETYLEFLGDDVAFKTPNWAKNAIFYQIFPDRFRNGDPTNDPVGDGGSGDILWKAWNLGGAVYAEKRPWNELPEDPSTGRDWFGGDLKGVQDEARYLADLGITAIYFNPIVDSTDNHGYTVIDYKSVSRYFGANTRFPNGTVIPDKNLGMQVFKNMTTELDKCGIKLILDGVFNHVSARNQWFDRDNDFNTLGAFESQTSDWYDWFTFYTWPSSYKAWSGVLNMPEVNEVDGFKNYVFRNQQDSVIKFWDDMGVDGWRLDTGQDLSHAFWKEFRVAYKNLNPEGYIVGEKFGDATPWLQGDEWDSVMNYRFRDAVLTWASGGTVANLDYNLGLIKRDYPSEAFYTAFNLLGSHDTERILTRLAGDKDRVKLAVIFQMVYPGTPVIYYGDEVGMEGLTDPDCRRPYLWADLRLDPDNDMLLHYKKLIATRKTFSVLRTGSLSTLLVDDVNGIYAFVRQDNSANPTAVLVFNNGDEQKTVTLDLAGFLGSDSALTDVLNYERYRLGDSKVAVRIDPLWAAILISGNVTLPSDSSISGRVPPLYYALALGGGCAVGIVATWVVWRRRKIRRASLIR